MGTLDFKFKNIDIQDLIDILYQFYVPKYNEEYEKFFKSQKAQDIREKIEMLNQTVAGLKSNETLIRMGHYSHIECVTLNQVRVPQTREDKHGNRLPWGQTRTLANGLYPFGWAKLEFCDIVSNPRSEKATQQKTKPRISEQKPSVSRKKEPPPMPPRKIYEQKPPRSSKKELTPIPPRKIPKPPPPPIVEEKQDVSALLNELRVIHANDNFGMNRLIDALEKLEDETEQKELAQAIQKKLQAAGTWKKHPRKFDIEIWME